MTEKNKTLFHTYLNGSLSEEEKIRFELMLNSDAALQEAYLVYQLEYFLAESLIAEQIKQQGKSIIRPTEKLKGSRMLLRGFVALLIGLVGYFLYDHLWRSGVIEPKSSATTLAIDSLALSKDSALRKTQPKLENGANASQPEIIHETNLAVAKETPPKSIGVNKSSYKVIAPIPAPSETTHTETIIQYVVATQATYQPNIVNLRRATNPTLSSALDRAKEMYLLKDYENTFRFLKEVPESQAKSASYLRGHAFFATKAYQEAYLEYQLAAQNMMFKKEAQWYALLATVAAKQEYQESLDVILADDNHPFRKEALDLKRKLEE